MAIPVVDGKYTGPIDVYIHQQPLTNALLVNIEGERIKITNLLGDYLPQFRELFGEDIVVERNEKNDLLEIFGDAETVRNYAQQRPYTSEEVDGIIERHAKRPFEGDLFTGYAAVEKVSEKIIGLFSIGAGDNPGESQSGAILNKNVWGQKYSIEAYALLSVLAKYCWKNELPVNEAPVNHFTATTLDSNEAGVNFLNRLGLRRLRDVSEKNYSANPRGVYGIKGEELKKTMEKILDSSRVTYHLESDVEVGREA